MTRRLAQVLSIVFHPIIFAILIPFIVMYHNTHDLGEGFEWFLLATFFVLIALLVFFFAKPREILNDIDISDRRLRPFFYTTSLIFAFIYFLIATLRRGFYSPLSFVALGIIIGIVVFEILNYFIKASVHVAVAFAFWITVSLLYGIIPSFIFIIAPIGVSFSRLYLKKHTLSEVLIGAVLGTMVCVITFVIAGFFI